MKVMVHAPKCYCKFHFQPRAFRCSRMKQPTPIVQLICFQVYFKLSSSTKLANQLSGCLYNNIHFVYILWSVIKMMTLYEWRMTIPQHLLTRIFVEYIVILRQQTTNELTISKQNMYVNCYPWKQHIPPFQNWQWRGALKPLKPH